MYRIEGLAFVYTGRRSRHVSTMLGYPIDLLANYQHPWTRWRGARRA